MTEEEQGDRIGLVNADLVEVNKMVTSVLTDRDNMTLMVFGLGGYVK